MAAEGGHEDIVAYLASKGGLGIDIDIKDQNGVSMKDCNRREIIEFELALFPGISERFLYSLSMHDNQWTTSP